MILAILELLRTMLVITWATLPEWAQTATQANPIFYMVNAFRYGLLGENATDINIGISYAVMLFFVVALGALGLWLLKRGTGLRS
jgi:ABC-2 type transport system permease protein